MGLSVFPAPVAASKTRYAVTLTSGTSWTVPAGVTYVNAFLMGGGGAGGGCGTTSYERGIDGSGGATTWTTVNTTPGAAITYAIGAGGTGAANTPGTAGGTTTFTGATSAAGGTGGGKGNGNAGTAGSIANNGGRGAGQTGGNNIGGAGGAGKIELEYWL